MTDSATLKRLIRDARTGRCLLRDKWEEAGDLTGREQLRLARVLLETRPATIKRHGRRVPCESSFTLRPKDRRRLVEALLEEGVSDPEIIAVVPKLTRRTFERIRSDVGRRETCPANGSSKRRFATKREAAVGRPQIAYLDATSGADVEAERRFRELVGRAA